MNYLYQEEDCEIIIMAIDAPPKRDKNGVFIFMGMGHIDV